MKDPKMDLVEFVPHRDGVENQVSMCLIVKRIGITGIDINQSRDLFWMACSHRAELLSCDGVPCKNRTVELECVNDSDDVLPETVGIVIRRFWERSARSSEAARCNAVDVI